MATVNLAEVDVLRSSRTMPILWSVDGGLQEPCFDYDDEGNPVDFGLDLEPSDPTADDILAVDPDSFLYDVSPSQFAETAIRVPEAGRVADFEFEGREYLRRVYDTNAPKVLLKCGRQVEKCDLQVTKVLLSDGRLVRIADMKPGDRVVALETLDPDASREGNELGQGPRPIDTSWRAVPDHLVRINSAGLKSSYRIVSRMGSECEVGEDTPFLTSSGWLCAGDLQVGMRIAAIRSMPAGSFGTGTGKTLALISLYGYAIADGGLTGWTPSITKCDPVRMKRITDCIDETAGNWRFSKDGRAVLIDKRSLLYELLESDGLIGCKSAQKFIPDWIFTDATREETVAFLRALWCDCDGSVKHSRASQWNLVYASTSRRLAEQVRALLWKFGIPSHIRRNNHPFYRDNPDPDVDQHLVRVETIEGVQKFLSFFTDTKLETGLLGDSNRDTYPLEIIQPLIYELCRDLGLGRREGRGHTSPMKVAGLRPTLKYPPSRAKLSAYVDFFGEWGGKDHPALSKLEQILYGDVIWDSVEDVTCLGEQEVFHLETATHHNYFSNGILLHNSTTLGNRLLCYSALTNNFRCLYVAPSAEQAKVFSNDRIKDVIDSSPLLCSYTASKINQAVFFKKFINFSQIRLRYAYLTADRVRGIPADLVTIDELQDILIDNIPVIEQCAFHSPYKLFLYSGTPKSMDNTLEFYWNEFSTQNEWIVPCERHGTPNDPSSWHWNVLGEKNIGKLGLVCDRCKEPISASHPLAKWAAMNPQREDNKDKVTFEGYRIPQIMVPWVDWMEILQTQEQYPRAQFMNEKLGLSYDSGVRPISKVQLKRCCRTDIRLGDIESFKRIAQGIRVYAGIDWGPGENASFTVITFGGYMGTGVFNIFWIHRFTGQDLEPERQLDLISQMLSQLQVQLVGVDYGGGFYQNDALVRRFGPNKIMKYQYNPRQKKKIYWEPNLLRWMCHRSEVMSDIFNALKLQKVALPCWDDFGDPYGKDILNVFSEFNQRLRMIEYKRAPGKPDDAFHSILYCLLASMIQNPRPDIIRPMKDEGIPQHHG